MDQRAQLPELPHGARGIAVGDVVVQFCGDKIVVAAPTIEGHYTLHFGNRSGILPGILVWCVRSPVTRFPKILLDKRTKIV
jgi:hypothetical protein